MIKSNFDGFLDSELMFQEASVNKNYYYNRAKDIHFYHDFSAYKTFDSQLDGVKKKYARRIQRFYETIQTPTVFLRYVANREEVEFISHHAVSIDKFLKSFCPRNRIIYIADCLREPIDGIEIYCVEKDKGDSVARHFLKKCPMLEKELLSYPCIDREVNLKRYQQTRVAKMFRNLYLTLKRYICKNTYTHSKVI